jgi:two-component system sensor histidine kinase KdpD
MAGEDGHLAWRVAGTLALTIAALAITTALVAVLGPLRVTNGAMLYLGAVLLLTLRLGRWSGVAAAVAAAVLFDFFFLEPRYTLTASNPDEWLVLLTFLLVAFVVSQLAAEQRRRAEEARAHEREAHLLHDLGELLAATPFREALRNLADRLRAELHAAAVTVQLERPASVATTVTVGDAELARAASGGAYAALGAAAGVGRWTRVAPPRGEAAGHVVTFQARVRVRDRTAEMGRLVLTWASRRDPPDAAATRLLETAARQLALVVERERLRAEATEAEVLRRTNQLQTALLNGVSHDLRTPLAGIIASAGSLRQTDVAWTAEDRAAFAENIEAEATRLDRIVGNLLDLGRLEGGALHPARDWHDPALVLADAVDHVSARDGGARFELDLPADLPPVLLDPVEIDQVVTNLLENAQRHGAPSSTVTVRARMQDGELRVSVEDSGPGVPEESLARIFDPFYRTASDGRSAGSGIGLAVARGLVAAHGGRIWAENRPEGGARITFTIPSPPPPEGEP